MASTPVHVKVEIDYDKLADAIRKALAPQTVTVTVEPTADAMAAVTAALSELQWVARR